MKTITKNTLTSDFKMWAVVDPWQDQTTSQRLCKFRSQQVPNVSDVQWNTQMDSDMLTFWLQNYSTSWATLRLHFTTFSWVGCRNGTDGQKAEDMAQSAETISWKSNYISVECTINPIHGWSTGRDNQKSTFNAEAPPCWDACEMTCSCFTRSLKSIIQLMTVVPAGMV